MNNIPKPKEGEYPKYFDTYLALNSSASYQDHINSQIKSCESLFEAKGAAWANRPYAEGKWTPKEVLGHLTDTERILTFRALCFARGEKSAFPGFDQDLYVLNAKFDQVATEDLIQDFKMQRMALLTLINILPEDSMTNIGQASGNPLSARALFWFIPGHFEYHLTILKERY